MRFPRPWALWKVCLLALLWAVLVFALAMALTIQNVGKVVMADGQSFSLSIFAEGWPPWVPVLAWVPAVGVILWRVVLPPPASSGPSRAV